MKEWKFKIYEKFQKTTDHIHRRSNLRGWEVWLCEGGYGPVLWCKTRNRVTHLR